MQCVVSEGLGMCMCGVCHSKHMAKGVRKKRRFMHTGREMYHGGYMQCVVGEGLGMCMRGGMSLQTHGEGG